MHKIAIKNHSSDWCLWFSTKIIRNWIYSKYFWNPIILKTKALWFLLHNHFVWQMWKKSLNCYLAKLAKSFNLTKPGAKPNQKILSHKTWSQAEPKVPISEKLEPNRAIPALRVWLEPKPSLSGLTFSAAFPAKGCRTRRRLQSSARS